MQRGKLIFLNGVTSTGKSTIAELIREMSHEIFYTSSNDIFHDMVSSSSFGGNFWRLVAHSVIAQYHAVRGMIDGGFNVIIDGMFLERDEYTDFFGKSNYTLFCEIFEGVDYVLIDLVCPPEELRRRNRVRGNRSENHSDIQLASMSKVLCPDLTIDVMTTMPDESAEMILRCASVPYDSLTQVRRERRRVRVLRDLLCSFDAAIAPSLDDHSPFVKKSGIIETTVIPASPSESTDIAVFLLLRGYSMYPKKCPGTIFLQRGSDNNPTEILRITTKSDAEKTDLTALLGEKVRVVVDRPLGSCHPQNPNLVYEVNYGYIPETVSGDGEEADAYILGISEPVREFSGTAAAVIHRLDDCEDKLVVIPDGITMHEDAILSAVSFVEKHFLHVIYLPKSL